MANRPIGNNKRSDGELHYLAAFDPDGNLNTTWDPDVDGFVNDMVLDGNLVYATGNFNNVDLGGGGSPEARRCGSLDSRSRSR